MNIKEFIIYLETLPDQTNVEVVYIGDFERVEIDENIEFDHGTWTLYLGEPG